MKVLLAAGATLVAGTALTAWLFFGTGHAADPGTPGVPDARLAEAARFVVHEWGTFTSFAGSDGVPAVFRPNNTDLPDFVYHQGNPYSKSNRLAQSGTVSMETPVVYFYADRPLRASVRVDFPRGWLTEWYPFAVSAPAVRAEDPSAAGQSMRWDVRLLPGETVRLPRDEGDNPYYHARDTDAVPVEAEVVVPADQRDRALRGGSVVQREKFLFYRGVGTFPPPVTVRALGEGKVRVRNDAGDRVAAAVLVTARGGKVGFRKLGALAAGAEAEAALPAADGDSAALAEALVKELTAAGLYEKEARAMVKTWDAAWFGEEGTRLLYLVPRSRTDELLPLAVEPKPTEVVRVLVGRHDFVTPEQEAEAERQVKRSRAAQVELQAAEQELQRIGRFAESVRRQAEKRLEAATAPR